MIFGCRVRVLGHNPSDIHNFTRSSTKNPDTWAYMFRLKIADDTGELTLGVYEEGVCTRQHQTQT